MLLSLYFIISGLLATAYVDLTIENTIGTNGPAFSKDVSLKARGKTVIELIEEAGVENPEFE